MRQALDEDIGTDEKSLLEHKKIYARKVLRKAITSCFVTGMTRNETETAFKHALEYCVGVRHDKLLAKMLAKD